MKKGQAGIVFAAGLQQFLLGAVLGPGRGQNPGVLGGVGVAYHHHQPPPDMAVVPAVLQQVRHHGACPGQVVQGFKQGRHRQVVAATGLFEQQMHCQHIRGLARHGDYIRTQCLGWLTGHHGTGVQHLAHRVGGLPVMRNQRAAAGKLPQQEAAPGVFIPAGVVAQAEPGGQLREYLGVAGTVLAHIVAYQVNTKAAHPAQ